MATYNKFLATPDYLVEGINCGSDTFTAFLTNTAPVNTNSVIADITQISYTNLSGRNFTTTSSSQTSGTYRLILAPLTLTASGTVATFRYFGVYDSTAAGGPLICWCDYGTTVTLGSGQTFVITPDQTNGLFSIT
jgi:hypothetical protein